MIGDRWRNSWGSSWSATWNRAAVIVSLAIPQDAAPSVMGGGMPGTRRRQTPIGKIRYANERKRKKVDDIPLAGATAAGKVGHVAGRIDANGSAAAAPALTAERASIPFTPEDFQLLSLFSLLR